MSKRLLAPLFAPLFAGLLLALAPALAPTAALAQSYSGGLFHDGVTLSASDLNTALATKLNLAAGTMTGKLTLAPSTTGGAMFNCPIASVPGTPTAGDFWCTSAGVFVEIGGSAIQLGTTSGAVTSFNTRTGAITLSSSDVTTALTFTPLSPALNLSDLSNAGTARGNLGLGSAAVDAQGTSGGALCLLNAACVASGSWTFSSALTYGSVTLANSVTGTGSMVLSASPALTGSPTVGGVAIVVTTDSRFGGPTQNSQSTAYGFVAGDAGGQVLHPSSDTTARTFTIPANASVAFPIGAKIEIVNDCSAGAVTLAITSDTLEWFPAGTTGSRTIAACGMGTLTKLKSTEWSLTGVGITWNLDRPRLPANGDFAAEVWAA